LRPSSIDDPRGRKALSHWPILVLRLYTGMFFAWYGFIKLTGPRFQENMVNFLTSQPERTVPFYRAIIDTVILPMPGLFAFLVAWGELALGAALIAGFATRYAAFAGAFLVLNFWLVKGQGVFDAGNHDVIWFVILIVLGGLHAGRVMGLDRKLGRRFPWLA